MNAIVSSGEFQMQLQDGDYSDLIIYLSGLFGIKKVPEIGIERFNIKYDSAVVLEGPNPGQEYQISRYPEKEERERLKCIILNVSGLIDSVDTKVSINWESVEFSPDPDIGMAEAFIDVLDCSTFRYF